LPQADSSSDTNQNKYILGGESSMQILLEVPEDLIQAIRLPTEEIPSRLKKELAVRLYSKGLLTFGKARQLAEMTRWDFHDLISEEVICRRYGVEELEDDLKTLEELS
jgi:predicted HTH domain antitoxin